MCFNVVTLFEENWKNAVSYKTIRARFQIGASLVFVSASVRACGVCVCVREYICVCAGVYAFVRETDSECVCVASGIEIHLSVFVDRSDAVCVNMICIALITTLVLCTKSQDSLLSRSAHRIRIA